MALISQAFIVQPNPDVSAKVVMVTLILRKADILIWKIIFHHFLIKLRKSQGEGMFCSMAVSWWKTFQS